MDQICGSGASNINFNIGNRSGLAVGEREDRKGGRHIVDNFFLPQFFRL